MSDPLKGLKPTPGSHVAVRTDDGSNLFRVFRQQPKVLSTLVASAQDEVGMHLIADAFNTYTATGLAPSQLAQALADEKALTAELLSQRDELVRALSAATEAMKRIFMEDDYASEPMSRRTTALESAIDAATDALARVKGGAR